MLESRFENATFEDFCGKAKDKRIVLFGAGHYVWQAIEVLNAYQLPHVAAIVDNDVWKWGKVICGIKCEPPNSLKGKKDVVILITTGCFFEVERQLLTLDVGEFFAFPLFIEQSYDICGHIFMRIPLS
jgi:hypothetical protein